MTAKPSPSMFYRIIYGCFAAWIIAKIAYYLICPQEPAGFYDYLYNYGGGFIRRGLSGEILFLIHSIVPVSPVTVCNILSVACLGILAYHIIKQLHREDLNWYLLLSGFALGTVALYGLDFMRRDYMELALLLAILSLRHRISFPIWIIAGNVIAIFAILLHEPAFFFMVPALILISNLRIGNIVKSSLVWLPSVMAFLLCCHFKGTPDMIPPVLESIRHHFPDLINGDSTPYALQFIGKESSEAIKLHIGLNFTDISGHSIPAALIYLCIILYTFYMTLVMPAAFARHKVNPAKINSLGGILIFQFICLTPMFTLLSCDYSRVALYWVISSLLIFIALKGRTQDLFKVGYNRLSDRFCIRLLRLLPLNRLLLTILFFTVGIPAVNKTITAILAFSPIHKILLPIKALILP